MAQKPRWQQRLSDFEKTLTRLEEPLNKTSFDELEKDGVIQRFEVTFELAWKTLRDYLEGQGVSDIASPKKAFRQAFKENLLASDELWLQMLEDRNTLSHLYRQDMSERIFQEIKNNYAKIMRDLILVLQKEIT